MGTEGLINILVVDDHVENLIAIEAILASPSYNICCVASGAEALQRVTQEEYTVILLDVQMPGLDGFETAQLIKSQEKNLRIPIIFITAIDQAAEHMEKGYAAGACDYIFKPFNPRVLRWKVEVLADCRQYYVQMEAQSKLLQQKNEELKSAHQQLYYTNANLERLIDRRTAELIQSDLQLQQEIAEHKRTKEHFRKIFALSPNLISIRLQNAKRYIDVNQSWLEHSGYSIEDLHSLGQEVFYHLEENVPGLEDAIEFQDKVHTVKVNYRTKKGDTRYGLLSTGLLETGGERQVLSVVTDITEWLHLENEMTRLDRLHLVSEMAASIGHEIRNPLTSVRGFLQMLAGNNKENPRHKEYYELMISELDRANDIISSFLSLSGHKPVELQSTHLNSIIESLYPLINADALRCDKNVVLELGEVEPLWLDNKEIRQLIMNLCRNGLEAMPDGGTLKLKTYRQANKIILEVRDQGTGIEQHLLDKIGTPFLTTKKEGTGLGLAVCFSIAHRHNARIEIKSGSTGTCILVIFPC